MILLQEDVDKLVSKLGGEQMIKRLLNEELILLHTRQFVDGVQYDTITDEYSVTRFVDDRPKVVFGGIRT